MKHASVWGMTAIALAALVTLLGAAPRLLAANSSQGKVLFEQCAACHALDDEARTTGPSLKGIIGRKAGSRDDFRYSPAMQRSSVIWNTAALDQYLADPQGFMAGNRMPFAGMPNQQEREDLIAFLEQASR